MPVTLNAAVPPGAKLTASGDNAIDFNVGATVTVTSVEFIEAVVSPDAVSVALITAVEELVAVAATVTIPAALTVTMIGFDEENDSPAVSAFVEPSL